MSDSREQEDSSFDNFIEDIWVRSLSCREWVRRFKPHGLSHGWSNKQIQELRSLYDNIAQYLISHVTLEDGHGVHSSDSISYHSKYGWVIASKRVKSYLGKVSVPGDMQIKIGRQSYISGHATLRGKDRLAIGSFTSIAEGLYLNTSPDFHPTEYAAMINFNSESRCIDDNLGMSIQFEQIGSQEIGIEIGNDVWIGRDVRIFHGSKIAHGSVIAERSLFRGMTEPYGVYAGVPAKLKKFRFSEAVVSTLLEVRWWEWSLDKILRNREFFATNLSKFDGEISGLIRD